VSILGKLKTRFILLYFIYNVILGSPKVMTLRYVSITFLNLTLIKKYI